MNEIDIVEVEIPLEETLEELAARLEHFYLDR